MMRFGSGNREACTDNREARTDNRESRTDNREVHTDTDTQIVASTTVEEGVINAAMLASIRNIELNVGRLYLHVNCLHASQAARPRPQRAHVQYQSTPPAHAQYQFTPPAQSHCEEGTRVPEKHHGRARGNARHSQLRTPEFYAYVH